MSLWLWAGVIGLMGSTEAVCDSFKRLHIGNEAIGITFDAKGLAVQTAEEKAKPHVKSLQTNRRQGKHTHNGISLTLGRTWRLEKKGRTTLIQVPSMPGPILRGILVARDQQEWWLSLPGVVVSIGVGQKNWGKHFVQRIAANRDTPDLLWGNSRKIFMAGENLFECSSQKGCIHYGRLGKRVRSRYVDEDRWWVVFEGQGGGLFRASRRSPMKMKLILKGNIQSICFVSKEEALFGSLTKKGNDYIYGVSKGGAKTGVISLEELHLLTNPILYEDRDPSLWRGLFRNHLLASLPGAASMTLKALQSNNPALRMESVHALNFLDSTVAEAAGWWLLASDRNLMVRRQTLQALADKCSVDESDANCSARLMLFLDDAEQELVWTARDALLYIDPSLALGGAVQQYKLDALSILAPDLEKKSEKAYAVLDVLSSDQDALVRKSAEKISNYFEP
jgi:hypothetical protein